MASSSLIIKTKLITSDSTEKFIEKFAKIGVNPDITENMELNFEIDKNLDRLDCYLTLASPEDAYDITEIYKDCYNGTYPYKEMENPTEVQKMIFDKDFYWILFRTPRGKTIGCFTYVLNRKQKRGYMRGLLVKKKYQKITNVKKLMIGSMIGMWGTFRNSIYIWYAECRTAHIKSQYLANICGIKPLAFLPNKDIFFNKIESDIFHTIYSEKVLSSLRKKNPVLIPEINMIYSFIQKQYNLEEAIYLEPLVQYDFDLDRKIYNRKSVKIYEEIDKFGYHKVIIKILGTDSNINFLYTPTVENIEKIKYNVNNDIALFVLLKELKRYASEKKVRYIECFVSAYKPNHQRIFCDVGFKIRGYIPSWKRVITPSGELFEDHIIFNLEKGKLNPKLQLIPEAQKIVDIVYRK